MARLIVLQHCSDIDDADPWSLLTKSWRTYSSSICHSFREGSFEAQHYIYNTVDDGIKSRAIDHEMTEFEIEIAAR